MCLLATKWLRDTGKLLATVWWYFLVLPLALSLILPDFLHPLLSNFMTESWGSQCIIPLWLHPQQMLRDKERRIQTRASNLLSRAHSRKFWLQFQYQLMIDWGQGQLRTKDKTGRNYAGWCCCLVLMCPILDPWVRLKCFFLFCVRLWCLNVGECRWRCT